MKKLYILILLFIPSLSFSQTSFNTANSTITKTGGYTITYSSYSINMNVYNKNLTISRDKGDYKTYTKRISTNTFDIGLIFEVEPSTNAWEFDILGYNDFDFYYQGVLSQEEINSGMKRPDNVIGSYAVYFKDQMKGKAFHIYRPQMIDKLMNKIWCNMSYGKGKLKIVCDKLWLKNASYPILLDPTLGYTSIGATDFANSFSCYHSWVLGCMPENGTATKVSLCAWTTGYMKTMIYDDYAVYPKNYIGGSYSDAFYVAITSKPTQNSELTTVNLSFPLTKGTTYWISEVADNVYTNTCFDTADNFYILAYICGREDYNNVPNNPEYSGLSKYEGYRYSFNITYTTDTTKAPLKRKAQSISVD